MNIYYDTTFYENAYKQRITNYESFMTAPCKVPFVTKTEEK